MLSTVKRGTYTREGNYQNDFDTVLFLTLQWQSGELLAPTGIAPVAIDHFCKHIFRQREVIQDNVCLILEHAGLFI